MDDLQARLTRTGLATLADYGFALAGGYALQAHQLVDRMSEDIDLFTNRWDQEEFSRAVKAVCDAYRRDGLEVSVTRQAETFARLQVADPRDAMGATVDLAADVRRLEPVQLSIGPVLAERDAVASKVGAVFSRGEARDYLDLAGILASGRFSRGELMSLGREADPGFTKAWFAEALAGVDRFPDAKFAEYGVDAKEIARVRDSMRGWSQDLAREIERERTTNDPPEAGLDGPKQARPHNSIQRRPSHQPPWPSPDLDSPSRGPEIGF